MESVILGKSYKVHLPGESPWAECLAIHDDGTWEGRIDNELVGSKTEVERRHLASELFGENSTPIPSLHDFRFGDIVRFKIEKATGYEIWVPAEPIAGHG